MTEFHTTCVCYTHALLKAGVIDTFFENLTQSSIERIQMLAMAFIRVPFLFPL